MSIRTIILFLVLVITTAWVTMFSVKSESERARVISVSFKLVQVGYGTVEVIDTSTGAPHKVSYRLAKEGVMYDYVTSTWLHKDENKKDISQYPASPSTYFLGTWHRGIKQCFIGFESELTFIRDGNLIYHVTENISGPPAQVGDQVEVYELHKLLTLNDEGFGQKPTIIDTVDYVLLRPKAVKKTEVVGHL